MNFRRDQASWLFGLQLESQIQIADNKRFRTQASHDFLGNSRNFVNKHYEVHMPGIEPSTNHCAAGGMKQGHDGAASITID
jgi:hypothetical protein